MKPTKGISPRGVIAIQLDFDRPTRVKPDGNLSQALTMKKIPTNQLTQISIPRSTWSVAPCRNPRLPDVDVFPDVEVELPLLLPGRYGTPKSLATASGSILAGSSLKKPTSVHVPIG